MAKKKVASGLKLTVEGTKLELLVAFAAEGATRGGSSLAKSTAGTSGFAPKTICAVHKEPVKAPKVCESCGPGVVMGDANTLKDFDGVHLSTAQYKALRPQGDDTIHVLYLTKAPAPSDAVVRLLPGMRALVPADAEDAGLLKKWSAFFALLGAAGSGRAAVARVLHRGSFRYCLMWAHENGAVIVQDLYLPEDCYEVPRVQLAVLPENHVSAFVAKGVELTQGFSEADVFSDPFREARLEAILKAARGEVVAEVEPPVVAPKVEEDLLALI